MKNQDRVIHIGADLDDEDFVIAAINKARKERKKELLAAQAPPKLTPGMEVVIIDDALTEKYKTKLAKILSVEGDVAKVKLTLPNGEIVEEAMAADQARTLQQNQLALETSDREHTYPKKSHREDGEYKNFINKYDDIDAGDDDIKVN